MKTRYLLPLAALSLLATPALAADARPRAQPQASIPFVSHGGVRDWTAVGRSTVYFQDRQRNWYRAELFAPAHDLPFAYGIGIETGGLNRLDKWGAIRVNGVRYPFVSFERVDGPPAKADKRKS